MRLYTKKMARLRDKACEAARAVRAKAGSVDQRDEFHPALLEVLWESGLMTLRAPKSHGGGEFTLVETAIAVEELARGSGAAALIVLLQAMGVSALARHASERQAGEWFERIVDGRAVLAFALSEPDPGPDEKPVLTTARKRKSEYVITGRKTFVSGAREADLVMAFAVTNRRAGLKKALSCFLVPAGTTGMLPGRELSKAGLRGVPAVELVFEGAKAQAAWRLGRQGQGYAIAKEAMIEAAPLAAALACGLLAEAMELSVELVRERDPLRSPLSESQPLELALADISAGLDCSRAIAWSAAGAVEEGVPEAERLAREAKWIATESAVSGVDQAVRLFGIEGSTRGSTLERLSRDTRACQLLLGPNHIHRIEAARKILAGK